MRLNTMDELLEGIIKGDRRLLGKALSLADTQTAKAQEMLEELLKRLSQHPSRAFCLGVSGPPGVGKSSFIDALGDLYLQDKKRVAVLAIDPSSSHSGGSILGDKTRMMRLSASTDAFIRPEASRGVLGGLNPGAEAMITILRAAPFDVVMVESVGVGQSEAHLAKLVDHLIVLVQPGAGDDLQAMKKGLMEDADSIVVNKGDGVQHELAQHALRSIKAALALAHQKNSPSCFVVSAQEGTGMQAIYQYLNTNRNIRI